MAIYCTLAQVQEIESVAGVNLRIDDSPSVYTAILGRASRWVGLYLLPHYSPASLAANEWVADITSYKAAQLFCKRRNNPVPQSIRDELEEITEQLKAIASGALQLPGGVRRRASIPIVSQPRVGVGPYGIVTTTSRNRGTTRANPPRDYVQQRDITEPPYTPNPG